MCCHSMWHDLATTDASENTTACTANDGAIFKVNVRIAGMISRRFDGLRQGDVSHDVAVLTLRSLFLRTIFNNAFLSH